MKKAVFLLAAIGLFLVKAQAQEGDWANFGRYEKSNAAVKALPQNMRNVVFLGNSIVDYWIVNDSTYFSNNHYIDRGISGQTTSQMLIRFRKDIIDLHPKVVIILAGTNDIAENTGTISLDNVMGNIKSMAALAKLYHIKPILCSVTPAFDYPWHKGLHPDIKIPKLNEMIKQYAHENHFIYVNYFSALTDGNSAMGKGLSRDGVHPTLAGYRIMEGLANKAIVKALH